MRKRVDGVGDERFGLSNKIASAFESGGAYFYPAKRRSRIA